ncbi:Glycosyl hydrolases family 2, TIM barrel domain [Cnuella takakiae]|uniref:Glycosyl hydrolases family 2, TIM barrel domain n=1 Tax=Cnuella takakiae TaxID=1302690 RepID=A0A1M5C036_9BACT|nr:glycoside hydrolase family 2 TIM barrel-domain containing protein [Cnuella takakiae]OLY93572.1 glycoside hydrolase [Cnuella takakiae]SHF48030.1 Glycosyl hydrolases family 2, TIM barrel domain [Cnuella takakiae]
MDATHPNYGLGRSLEEQYEDVNFINPLPRAVIRPTDFMLLDGEWRFAIDPDDRGLHDGWHLGYEYTDNAHWPGSIEQHLAQAKGQQTKSWSDTVVAWYEREFPTPRPANMDSGSPHSMLQLTFGACGYETRVWLNGIPLKTVEGEEVHYGEYTSFSFELRQEILRPVNRLTVRIADTMDADIPRGKQESHVYKRGGIWYQTYTGAVRSIWLETVERNRLRSRVGVVSIVEDKMVRFNLTTRIHDPGQYVIRLKVYDQNGHSTQPLAQDTYPIKLEAGQKNQRLVLEIPDAQNWSPEAPNLYRLVAQLIDRDGYVAEIETHFGIRKIEARGCCVYLNNKSVYLDGILYQPGTATYEEIEKHMYAMKKLGCNLVRIHIAGIDPRIYNLADRMGMMLWVEVPSPHRSSERSRQAHKEELMRMLALIGTHPSVVIWSLYNEDWGAQDIATNPETRKYIVDIYHYMQIAQPQFLVVDNDGWHHISYEGRLKSDLLTAHLYTPELGRWKEMLNQLVAGQNEGVAAFPLVVGDPFFYRRHIPLIVSEWGGFGFSDYGGPKDNSARAADITDFKREMRQRSIAGDVYTQATDIEDEVNGLIDGKTGQLKVPENLLRWRDRKE